MQGDQLHAWRVNAHDYPADAPLRERLLFALRFAVLAPSGHNLQPWRFRVGDDFVELERDPQKALAVVDPDDREMIISCGAALYHLRLALRRFGLAARIERLPLGPGDDLLARATIIGEHQPDDEERRRFDAITRRRTTRTDFDAQPLPDALVQRLVSAASAREGTRLEVIDDRADRLALAGLVTRGIRTQFADRSFRRELASCVRPNHSPAATGLPGYALGLGDVLSRLGPAVIRRLNIGRGEARKVAKRMRFAPLLAIIKTDADDRAAHLATGHALAAVLLAAAAERVTNDHHNAPLQVAELRAEINRTVGGPGHSQLILRLGFGSPGRPTPRQAVDEVLVDAEPSAGDAGNPG